MNEHKYFKFIGDGSISRDDKGEYSNHVYAQCPYTSECRNDQCFFKQRDCYGRNPWVNFHPTEEYLKTQKDLEKYGEMIFPEWVVFMGTNTLMLHCKDFK